MPPASEPICHQVQHGSDEYAATVALRDAILRKPLGLAFDPRQLAAECDSIHLGCWVEGELVGCVVLRPLSAGEVQLRQMAVAPHRQRMGIGARLVAYAEQLLRSRGYREVSLHARRTAVGFYQRLGYRQQGEEFIEVTIPHITMRKTLR
jgi:ribosomal protein S18 acetylase RimI-like enzyme